MADQVDLAYADEAVLLEATIQAARRSCSTVPRGRCLYCDETCNADAVLHEDCREDYERVEAIRRRQGTLRRR